MLEHLLGLHRCRKQFFFQGEKIISLRKCVERPCFSYSDFDCYFSADTSALESEIDRLVYQLYGLTEDEINIVEEES